MFSAAVGLQVEYNGMVGTVKFVDDLYITVCVKAQREDMISDVCIVVYPHEYDNIKLITGNKSRA